MKFLTLALMSLALFVGGCTKKTQPVVCSAAKSVSSLVASQIVTQLSCKNLDAVKADLDAQLEKLNICEKAESARSAISAQSAIGDLVCKPVVDALVAGALAQVPAAWECSGGKVTEDVKASILAACTKAL